MAIVSLPRPGADARTVIGAGAAGGPLGSAIVTVLRPESRSIARTKALVAALLEASSVTLMIARASPL